LAGSPKGSLDFWISLITELGQDLDCGFDRAADYAVSFPDLYYKSKAYEQLKDKRKGEQQYRHAIINRLDGLLSRPIVL
jgi:hypothetical protein